MMYTGCSGYYYREWKGSFYPQELPASKWLQYYAQHFNTIEINSTFYKMPSAKSLANWYRQTPEDFVFTIKANKLFTHLRRMKQVNEELQTFYDVVLAALQEKAKCILFQFPASVKYNEALLQELLELGNRPLRPVIEFRDLSWWREDVQQLFRQAGLTFCNISLPDFPDIFVANPAANYLRFHGKPVLYKSGYDAEGLAFWLEKARLHPADDLYAYFNNTWFGAAINDARMFASALATNS
jgi:uncharacterized protein YecE (DUF72 family)